MEGFVTFEIAKKLKEKGFDWETSNVFERNIIACRYEDYPKPTISQVLKWLREEKKLHISTGFSNVTKWRYIIIHLYENYIKEPNIWEKNFDSHEEAALAGIEYVLDNLI